MKDETILCLRTDEVQAVLDKCGVGEGFTPFDGPALFREESNTWEQLLSLPAHWLPRNESTENDESFLQIIPYVMVETVDLSWPVRLFLSYSRNKGGEKRLDGKRSIGIGGHINLDDADSSLPSKVVIARAALREVSEETGVGSLLNARTNLRPIGIIRDTSDPVGRVHLGIVMATGINSELLHPAPEIGDPQWHPIHAYRDMPLESWSRLIVDRYVGGGPC